MTDVVSVLLANDFTIAVEGVPSVLCLTDAGCLAIPVTAHGNSLVVVVPGRVDQLPLISEPVEIKLAEEGSWEAPSSTEAQSDCFRFCCFSAEAIEGAFELVNFESLGEGEIIPFVEDT